jgi:hypothetical protein
VEGPCMPIDGGRYRPKWPTTGGEVASAQGRDLGKSLCPRHHRNERAWRQSPQQCPYHYLGLKTCELPFIRIAIYMKAPSLQLLSLL